MPAHITDETLHTLINLIYEATCDRTVWPEFLRATARAVEGRLTSIFEHNFETLEAHVTSDASAFSAAVDWDPAFMKSYEERYTSLNPWARNEPALKTGRAVTGTMLCPGRDLVKSEFYNDWLRHQDYFYLLGGVIVRDGSWSTHFSTLRSRRLGDFSREQVRLYQGLVPHLSRAVRIQHRFAFLQSLSSSSLAMLDTVPAAVMLLDPRGRVLHGNAAAQAELGRADPFRLNPSGEICVRGASHAQTAVRTAIAAVLDPPRAVRERLPTVAQVSRRNGEVLSVQLLRLPQGDRAARATMIGQRLAACALVVHGVAKRSPTVGLQLLRQVYGLTPAEVQIALAIAEGETVKGYAERRRISRNTAASQLKRAFDKTGLRRQSELVRWLLLSGVTPQPRMPRY